jgi:glycosyltransferase involved in cell wall biosynthesis
MPTRLSVIVPFHHNLAFLTRCLEALDPLPPDSEVVIVADGAVEDCRAVAAASRARVIVISDQSGPAVARNVAARTASADVLVFIDADVVVSAGALDRIARIFLEQPATSAVFGAYDERPWDPGFVSQYKNLAHSYIHQSSATNARTFWAGFGAVRREAFQAVGGFDERFRRPSVEDIDLGYRLTRSGHNVILDPSLRACHLKRWTLAAMIRSDVRDRGIPWMQLILRYGALSDDLNLRTAYRVSVVLAYLAVASLALGIVNTRFLVIMPFLIVGLGVTSWRYYAFFYRLRGCWFAIRAFPLHVLHHLCNGCSFAIGTAFFVATRLLGMRFRGALPLDGWGPMPSDSGPPQVFSLRLCRSRTEVLRSSAASAGTLPHRRRLPAVAPDHPTLTRR